jgi:hypothetical protein
LDVTAPIYRPDDEGKPIAVGSSVLIAIGPIRFLVSAAHVLDVRRDYQLVVGAGSGLVPLAGDFTRLYSTSALSAAEDHVDVGIVRLSGKSWDAVALDRFAQWLELDHSGKILADHTFALLGYPLTKQRESIEGLNLVASAYRMAALECGKRLYEQEGHDPKVNLLLGFDRRKMWGIEGRVTAPDLYGVSGGGLWRFGRRLRDTIHSPRLSAIAIEWRKRGRYKYVLGTRIEPIVAALVERYADVRDAVRSLARMLPNKRLKLPARVV